MTDTFDRATYPHWASYPTRWNDNDIFGHVNNTVHYEVMDTAINDWLKAHDFDVVADPSTINLIPESSCRYLAEISYPDSFEVGVRVTHVGSSSVRWECALVRASDGVLVAVTNSAHVFVEGEGRRPTPIPADLRASLEGLCVAEGDAARRGE